jgi:ABC-type multidrug transport system fused ATPase/permease subunit
MGYIVFSLLKYFLLYITVLNSNKTIHNDMIHSLVRSPCCYFDITSSGSLNNKFSNDLEILGNILLFVLTDALEGPIISIILLVNVFSINLYFIIPGTINIIFIVIFFNYCKRTIISVKQLELRLKSPVLD